MAESRADPHTKIKTFGPPGPPMSMLRLRRSTDLQYFRAEPGKVQERFSTSTLKCGGGGGSRKTMRTISPTTAYLQHMFRHQFPSHAKQGSMLAWVCHSPFDWDFAKSQTDVCASAVCAVCALGAVPIVCAFCAVCVGALGAVKAALVLRVCCGCCLCSLCSWCFCVVCGGAACAARAVVLRLTGAAVPCGCFFNTGVGLPLLLWLGNPLRQELRKCLRKCCTVAVCALCGVPLDCAACVVCIGAFGAVSAVLVLCVVCVCALFALVWLSRFSEMGACGATVCPMEAALATCAAPLGARSPKRPTPPSPPWPAQSHTPRPK